MAGLHATQTSLHLIAILEAPPRDGFAQTLQRVFHVSRETMPDGFLFLLAAGGLADGGYWLGRRE
jgi:hypothetical protein